MKKLLIAIFTISIASTIYCQKYKEMMSDTKYNVYDVIKEGNLYFKDKTRGKGSGYKQFKRWIIQNEDRFYPTGNRTAYNPALPYHLRNTEKLFQKNTVNTIAKSFINTYSSVQWTEIGPFVELKKTYDDVRNGNGRVDAIWVDPANSDRIYMGCRGGGLWVTIDGGDNWYPKTDDLGITGVNSIAVNPNDVDEIYIATAIAGRYSIGIFKSENGGDDWIPTNYALNIAADFTTINKIILDPNDASTLFAATSKGLLKFTNNLQNQTTVIANDNIIDIEFRPGSSLIVYATNKTDKTLYRSSNGGTIFLPTTAVGVDSPKVAVTPADPDYVYFSDDGLTYKSTDNGLTFNPASIPDANVGQYGGFAVSDVDKDLIINGSIDTYRSTDGAATDFTKVTNWVYNNSTGIGGNFVHADIREAIFVNGDLYLGTDGWLCKSTDGGLNYEILSSNVGNHEIYEHGIGISQSDNNTLVVGTQDNGTSILLDGVWHHWRGGDGGTSLVDHSNKNIIYGSLFNGDFKRTDFAGTTETSTDLGDTKPGTLPPLVQHPTLSETLFLGEGFGQVWKSPDKGATWSVIGNFGLTGANDDIDELAVAPSNPDYIYTSMKNRIWVTKDGGSIWTEVTGTLPNLVIKGIAIDYDDPEKVTIVYTNYDATNKVYTSNNAGGSWNNITLNIPNLPLHDIVYDNKTNNGMYVASDVGVYYIDDTLSQWQLYGTGLPNTQINDLEIQHATQKIYVGTWGRGVWSAPLVNEAIAPVANFNQSKSIVYKGSSVTFSDTSTNNPTSWSWSFPGGTPSASSEQNPNITYTTSSTYDVVLTATNQSGSNSITKTGTVTVIENTDTDLELYLNFNNNIEDHSPNLRNGVVNGATLYTSGKKEEAYLTTPTNNITVNEYKGIGGANARTVSAWIKTGTNGASRKTIISWGEDSTGKMFNVMLFNGNIRVEAGSSNVQNDDSTIQSLFSDTWRHIAVTFDNSYGPYLSNVKLYIDGVYYANQPDSGDSFNSEPTTINTDNTINNVLIGNAAYNTSYIFDGEIDDLQLYSRALTSAEIQNLYNNAPISNFTSNVTSINESNFVQFTDTSLNNPKTWLWSFPGGVPSTSKEQHPIVAYNTAGTYNVSLTTTNTQGSSKSSSSTKTKITENNYIEVFIFNNLGKKIYHKKHFNISSTKISIDTTNLRNGVYLVRLIENGIVKERNLIKQ